MLGRRNNYLFCGVFLILGFQGLCQHPRSTIKLKAILLDKETGRVLPVKVSTFWEREKIREYDNATEVPISIETDTIVFESKGYQAIKYPTHFYGLFEKETYVQVDLKTTKSADSLDILTESATYFLFCKPVIENEPYQYERLQYRQNILVSTEPIDFKQKQELVKILPNKFANEGFHFLIKTSKQLINELKVQSEIGFNFVDFNAYPVDEKTLAVAKINSIILKDSNIKTFYFEQSKYDLHSAIKSELDSLLVLLKPISDYKLIVKGFGDLGGYANKNTKLAEYRAKVIATYLSRNGVQTNKIKIDWEKPHSNNFKENKNQTSNKNRSVEIEIQL